MANYFYNKTIRTAVSIFGSLFNEIYIKRNNDSTNTAVSRVPLAYGPKSKFLARLEGNPDLEDQNIALKLPRISFEITNLSPDPTSKLNGLNKCITSDEQIIYAPTPYLIDFSLSVYAKNQDDMLQIIEQIIPYFDPTYSVTMNDETHGIKTDIPITMNDGIGIEDSYEGDFVSRRAIIYTLTFTMKVNFYKRMNDAKRIYNVKTNLGELETVTVNYDTNTEECTVEITDFINEE